MPIKVIVNGASGKMGTVLVNTLKQNPDFELVQALGRNDNLPKAIHETNAQVVVDLTTAESVYKNSLAIIEANVHPVIGTSGLLPDQIASLQEICSQKKLGGIIAPNFSLGAVLMMKFAGVAAKYFPIGEVVEAHHEQKIDAPSQTALKTAEIIADSKNKETEIDIKTKENIEGARGANFNNVPIHSLRMPGVLARQEVIFGGIGETLTVTHNTLDRQSFMPGILLCCRKVLNLTSLYYGLESILQL